MRIRGAFLASITLLITVNVGRNLLVDPEEDTATFHEQFPTKDACLGATAEGMARCTSPGCEQLVFSRMHQCLDRAEGDKELFCENVEGRWQDSAGRDIFETHCEQHSPHQTECEKLIWQVGGYCARLI